MTAVCLSGECGVSMHAGGLIRLWGATTGRRLAAHQQRFELTACAAYGPLFVAGDAAGALHAYNTDAEFGAPRVSRGLEVARSPGGGAGVRSVALLPGANGGSVLALCSSLDGLLSASPVLVEPWQTAPLPRARVHAPPAACADTGCPLHLAAGPPGGALCAAGGAVALLDVETAATSWSGRTSWPDAGAVPCSWRGVASRGAGLAASMGAMRLAGSAAGEGAGAPAAAEAVSPSRPVSYSPFWRLAAAASDGAVSLWDVRCQGDRGPAASVSSEGSAAWVHLDEGGGMAGHLAVAASAESSRGVEVYDVRRLPRAKDAAAVRSVARLAAPPAAVEVCFAALGSTLVVGGGATCAASWRYCGAVAAADAGEEEEEEERRPKKEKKKKRQATKEFKGSRQARMA